MNHLFRACLVVFLLLFSGLVSCSHRANASILDCLEGELITREFTASKREPKRFMYSASCQPSDEYYRERDKKKLSSILLEFKVEVGKLIEPIDNVGGSEKVGSAKAYLTLSSGSNPLRIQSFSSAHKRKSVFSRDYLDYKIYKREFEGQRLEYIFHKKSMEFFISCGSSYCLMDGIDAEHGVYYELQIFDSGFRDWVLEHELMMKFIEASYIHGSHK